MRNSIMKKEAPPVKPDDNIMSTIIARKDSFPKKQKMLCNYIVEQYQSIGFLTVKELADAAGVGTTTVMRLVQMLGFSSYVSMRKAIHDVTLQSAPYTWWTMEKSFNRRGVDMNETLPQVWQEITDVLGKSFSTTLQDNFNKAVDLLLEASVVNILGLRASRSIADYFHYVLEEFYPKTNQLSFDSEMLFDRILRFKADEILFVITFYPYVNKTIEAAQFCHERGNKIVLLTDHLSCPIARYASVVLKTEPSKQQYSIVPAVSVLEALVIELGRRTSETSINSLKELGAVLKKNKINYLEQN
ncbi:MurR/RpiR family transcriptional regulator [Paenibacillus cymbidii]|uniref:MurR/RpiR family transcriptional regulator n=1 Tax=Paenibacillus cymbidii TaxID=1639034 RepID=UPI001F3C1328|nr:MurR/RpiR family transcriptional regulator [Paenibacillus cymbidii]